VQAVSGGLLGQSRKSLPHKTLLHKKKSSSRKKLSRRNPPRRSAPAFLRPADLRKVVRLAPLIAIDLIVRNVRHEVLLGLRNNAPAKGFYFVPGGMILKNESLRQAFARLAKNEINCEAKLDDARLLGVYEHFYADNRFGEPGYGTHYVVLGYELKLDDASGLKGDAQHSELRWWSKAELLASGRVHDNTKAYFR
jgi:colanic acid biosynthesis protein WcaH